MKRVNSAAGILGAALLVGGLVVSGRQQSAEQAQNVRSVTKEQFDGWMTQLSNWGRWGKGDEIGALNLITPAKRKQAAGLVKTGTTVSLAREIPRQKVANTPQNRPINPGGALVNLFLIQGDYLFERQEIEYHGGALSHFDALCHVSYNGKLYNGHNFKEVVTPDGG